MPNISPAILTQFAMPDPNAAPLNLTQLFTLANTLVSSEIQGTYLPYIIQNGPPGVDDQDKAWIELDTVGRPVNIKIFWHGFWRRVYNGMLGEIRGFHGDPGYGPPPKNFNADGLGNPTGDYDGWAICNGKNGTPDLSDRFIIGAHMNNTDHPGYQDGEWQTWVSGDTGQHMGGTKDFTLTDKNTFRPPNPGFGMDHFEGDTGRNPAGHIFGIPDMVGGVPNPDITILADPGNTTPDSISVINPFIALGWIIFVGYST